MKKLKMSDLTPAVLKEVMKLDGVQEVIDFFAAREFEVSEKGAAKILEQLKGQNRELTDDELDKVAGGCGGGSDPHTYS